MSYHVCVGVLVLMCLKNIDAYAVEAILHETADLPCITATAGEGDALNVLVWYKDEAEKVQRTIYRRDFRNEDTSSSSEEGRFQLIFDDEVIKLRILNVMAGDEGFYHCSPEFANTPGLFTNIQLFVIEPPQRVYVGNINGTRLAHASSTTNATVDIGPYYIGDTVHLFCVSFGGNPQPTITWQSDGVILKNTSMPLSDTRLRNDVKLGPLVREDDGRMLTCQAYNNKRTPPIYVNLRINMTLPAAFVSIRTLGRNSGTVTVRAGEPVTLQCRVLGAQPAPAVIWQVGEHQLYNIEQNVTVDESRRALVSEVEVILVPELDECRAMCCALTNDHDTHVFNCSKQLPLTVYYPPTLTIVADDNVINGTISVPRGSQLRLNCSERANPPVYELEWYHGEEILTKEHNGSHIDRSIVISSVSDSDAGEYSCAASNQEGSATSDLIIVDVTYPPTCADSETIEYGVVENDVVNITCNMNSNPAPDSYQWLIVNATVNTTTMKEDIPYNTTETKDNYLMFTRPADTDIITIFCKSNNGLQLNGVPSMCVIWVTEETVPRPPEACRAVRSTTDITVTCQKGYDGGLPQKFILTIEDIETQEQLTSITNLEPHFIFQEPATETYKLYVLAQNKKGDSEIIVIAREEIIGDGSPIVESAVADIKTLSLSLFGGVALLALVACGLVLCTHARETDHPPTITAYNTDESNCDTCNSDDEHHFNRTESFRRAVNRCPSRNYDMRRTSSFHSPRCLNNDEVFKCESVKYTPSCRVHSMQNIYKKREADVICTNTPHPEAYTVPTSVNTFYTMPRKIRHRSTKEISDQTSEITQNSDGFSLPPPPDEFTGYRVGTQIKDLPAKVTPTYSTINKKHLRKESSQYGTISPNIIGVPTVSGSRNGLYSYPDEVQVNNNPFEHSE